MKDGAAAWSKAPTSLSAHLAESVLALIKDEGLAAGDRLPSVKELAERFSVATPTMREARSNAGPPLSPWRKSASPF